MNITLAEIICGVAIAGIVAGVPVAVYLWDRRTGGYAAAASWSEPPAAARTLRCPTAQPEEIVATARQLHQLAARAEPTGRHRAGD